MYAFIAALALAHTTPLDAAAHAAPRASPSPDVGGTVVGIVLGGAGGAALGVGVALIAGAAADAASGCSKPGARCTDRLDGGMAMLEAGAVSLPLGAFVGAVAGGFTGSKLGAGRAPQARVDVDDLDDTGEE